MPVERASGGTSLIDVLDRVLDKGIVVDAWARVSPGGIDLRTVEARVVVASTRTPEDLLAENASLRAQLAAATAPQEGAAVRRTRQKSQKL